MEFTFPTDRLMKIVEFVENNDPITEHWGQKVAPGRYVMLVGNNGLYIMPACIQRMNDPDSESGISYVAYANECNPTTMEFDEWWANKRDGYGADDGADIFPLDLIKDAIKKGGLSLSVTENEFVFKTKKRHAQTGARKASA